MTHFTKLSTLSIVVGTLALIPSAYAGGKKRSAPEVDPGVTATPVPVRKVELLPVKTLPFTLPNGSRVDLSTDLGTMVVSAVSATDSMVLSEGEQSLSCEPKIYLEAVLSSIDLNLKQFGFSIGYGGNGELKPIQSIGGTVKVKVGAASMDFRLKQCLGSRCTTIAAVSSSAKLSDNDLTFDVDFGVIRTAPQFIWNTPFSKVARQMIDSGIKALAQNKRFNDLHWHTTVRDVSDSTLSVILDAGSSSNIHKGQTFTVYSAYGSVGLCDVVKPVAHITTTEVERSTSWAEIDKMFGSTPLRSGDIVYIREGTSE